MAFYTKLYPLRLFYGASFVPAAWAGGWDLNGTVTNMLDGVRYGGTTGSGTTTATRAEAVTTSPYRVGVFRGVSRRLAPQTISGTVDFIFGLSESNIAADFFTRMHLYVIKVSDESTLGTPLNQYEESSGGGGTEWPTTNTGLALQSAQTLTAVVVPNDGADYRLVAEIGYRSENTSATSRTGTMRYGGLNSDLTPMSDLTAGSTSTTTLAGFLQFSTAIDVLDESLTNYSPQTATLITSLPATITQDPLFQSSELWFKYIPTASEPALGIFAGISDAGGSYRPMIQVWNEDGAGGYTRQLTVAVEQQPYIAPLWGVPIYFGVFDLNGAGGAPGASLVLQVRAAPALPSVVGSLLITSDTTIPALDFPAHIFSPATGVVTTVARLVASEHGAILAATQRLVLGSKRVRTEFYLYDLGFTLLNIITLGSLGGQVNPPVGRTLDTFYIGQRQSGGTSTVWTFDSQGTVSGTTWTLPSHASTLQSIYPSLDGTVLYYTRDAAAAALFRHDLVNDVPLADLALGEAGLMMGDARVMLDGNILVALTEYTVRNYARVYNPAGTLLYSFDLGVGTDPNPWFIDHVEPAPVVGFFWVWLQSVYNVYVNQFTYQLIRIADGAVVTQLRLLSFEEGMGNLVPLGAVPPFYFAPFSSCPLLILSAGGGLGGELGPLAWVHTRRRVA